MTETMEQLSLQLAVTAEQRQNAIQLLEESKLPVADINDDTLLYLLRGGSGVMGTAGLEIFEDCALLRSFSVVKQARGKGYGKFISEQIEHYASESGINCLYLLTNTAQDFFDKQGYCAIQRNDAPLSIRQSQEFTTLCPSSSVVMKKKI